MKSPSTIRVLPSVCALDCPDACALHIQVDAGKVVGLTGDPKHPITRGFACVKTARYPERQEQSDRLLHPMRRTGRKGEGKFEQVTWETALDEISERLETILKTHGGKDANGGWGFHGFPPLSRVHQACAIETIIGMSFSLLVKRWVLPGKATSVRPESPWVPLRVFVLGS